MVKLQNYDFPTNIWINVPKGRKWRKENQTFCTDDLPERLLATYIGTEEVEQLWGKNFLVKYSVEPIFNLEMSWHQKDGNNGYFDLRSINEICKLISQPFLSRVRSANPRDQFVRYDTSEKPYWLYEPEDDKHLFYSQKGTLWKMSVIPCEDGYYYQVNKSKKGSKIRKVASLEYLEKPVKAVKPVVFFDAREFVKSKDINLAYA